MRYQCSRARREFEAQLDAAMKELAPLYKYAHKHGGAAKLLAAYYVFAYAQFEVYVKSFIEDALNTLNTSPPPFEKLPDLMLGYLLHKTENLGADYRKFGYDDDEGAVLRKVAQTARKIAHWSSGAKGVAIATPVDFLAKKKYPSPKNMPQLFRRLGVETIWGVIGKAGRINAEMILTSLNDLRTGIAHEGRVPPGFSMSDFRDRLAQMGKFVAAIDRGVSKHFCSGVISRTAWNASML